MSGVIECGRRIYMNGRDLTPWVKSSSVTQGPVDIHRTFRITFMGWSSIEADAEWDIFGSYDPTTTPRAEDEIRNGVVPQDRTENADLATDKMTLFRVVGYSRAWEVMRRRPRKTLVLTPARGPKANASIKEALRRYKGPVGSYTELTGLRTMHEAVRKLARLAKINVTLRIPNYPLAPVILGVNDTYWSAIKKFVDPFDPHVHYTEGTNTLAIVDSPSSLMGASSPLVLPSSLIGRMSVAPSTRQRPGRVLVTVQPWR